MTGLTINNYTFGEILGKGGMAIVYRATKKNLNSTVAIKVLNKEFVYNTNIRNRFLAEARSMFNMVHPNIVRVTDLIEEGEIVAFVMDYMEGETLKQLLEKNSRLSVEEIKSLLLQMLDAAGYVHEQGLVHRDIKPSNFIVDKKNRLKLLDFGIAKNSESGAEYTQTGTSQNMGTPMYMSPEQVKEAKNVHPQSDIYSLGVVLWQMVAGSKPYNAATLSNFDLQSKIVNEPLVSTGTIWDSIIQKATRKKMEERYPSVAYFKNAVQNIAASGISAHRNFDEADTTIIETGATFDKPVSLQTNEVKEIKRNWKGVWIGTSIVLAGILVFLILQKKEGNQKSDTALTLQDTTAGLTYDTVPETIAPVIKKSNPKPVPAKDDYTDFNEVANVIRDFYDTENRGNHTSALMDYYEFPVNRYFTLWNVSHATLYSMVENAFQTGLAQHYIEIYWDSFQVERIANGGYRSFFNNRYSSAPAGQVMRTKNQSLIIEMNSHKKITAIYENK